MICGRHINGCKRITIQRFESGRRGKGENYCLSKNLIPIFKKDYIFNGEGDTSQNAFA